MSTIQLLIDDWRRRRLLKILATTSAASLLAAHFPASAEILPAGNVVSACSGVSLPRSTVTSLVTPIVLAGVTPVQNGVNSILNAPLLSTALGALAGTNVNVDLTSSVAQVNSGAPITLKVLADDGTVIGPSGACYSRASKFTLTSPAGLSIGGNVISGLGDASATATSAGEINSIAFGNAASTAASATRSIAIGTAATVGASATGAVALGNQTQVTAANGIALGNGAQATAANSIALGASATAARGAQTNYTAYALTTPQTSAGEVSIGSAGAARQITNVAAGSGATDAVNVSQLTAVGSRLDSLSSLAVVYDSTALGRITLGGASGTTITNLAAGTVSAASTDAVNGSQLYATNQSVATNATAIAATNVQLTALTNGGAGVVRYSNAGTPTVANGGTASNDATLTTSLGGSVGLHNLTAGALTASSTDAVNGGQLYATNQAVAANTTQVTAINNGGAGVLRYSNAGSPTVANGGIASNDATLTTSLGGSVGLHNLTAGILAAGSTDAVNGGQLYTTNQAVAANTTAIAATNTQVTALNDGGAGVLRYSNAGTPTVANGGTATNDMTLTTSLGGAVWLHNLAAGALTANSTDAVNGAQLYATNQAVAANASQVAALNSGGIGVVRYSNAGTPTVANGGTASNDATLATSLGGSVALHNLTAGTLAAGSTDAVNGGQLYTTNQAVAALNNGGTGVLRYSNAGTPTVANGGIASNDMTLATSLGGSVGLHNLTAGALTAGSTDAVNGGQLYTTNQAVAANAAAIVTTNNQLASLTSNYTSLTAAVGNGAIGPVQYANPGSPTTPNGGTRTNDITFVGQSGASPVSLHNVAAGGLSLTSTDAVNGGQVVRLGTQVASALGGFTYNASTNSIGGNFTIGGNHYATVQDALNAVTASNGGGSAGTGTGTSGTAGSSSTLMYFHTNSTTADSNASGANSTAIGTGAASIGNQSVAMGMGAIANGQDSVAIGTGATAQAGKAVSIGLGNMASGDGAVSIGDPNIAQGDGAVALGKDNTATGVGAIALGNVNVSAGNGAAAIGSSNSSTGDGAVAIGSSNSASGIATVALGSNNMVAGDYSLAIGNGITASASNTLAIGQSVHATATNAMAIGNNAAALASDSIAIGVNASATGMIAGAVGNNARATGFYSLALGPQSNALSIASTAVGVGASVTGFAAVAIGSGSEATAQNSVALGSAVQTLRGENHNYYAFGVGTGQNSNGEVALAQTLSYIDPRTGLPTTTGNRQLTGVAAGSVGTDAVNLSQLMGVSTSLGTALASGLGGGSTYNPVTGTVTAPSYSIGGYSYGSVGDALQALAAIGSGQAPSAGSGGSTPPVPVTPTGNAVAYDSGAQDTVTLAGGGTRVTNVAAGIVTPGSTDAVNGGQLAVVNAKADTNTTAISTLANRIDRGAVGTVQYSRSATPTAPNGGMPTNDVTLVGANPVAPVALHNVAVGNVAAGSTDAVNGGQLAATNQRVAAAQATATSALAISQNAVQYDDASHGSVTLGGSGSSGGGASAAVALRNVANGTQTSDAVNVGQLTDAASTAIKQSNAYTDAAVRDLRFDLANVRNDVSAGTAGAMALAGMPQPYEAGRGMIAMGVGAFRGQTAIAIGASKAFADEHTVMKLGTSYNSRGDVGINAGIGYQF